MNLNDCGLVQHTSKTVSTGDRFGRLVVLHIGKPPGTYRYAAICQCDCGKEHLARLDGIVKGAVVSCGCYHKENNQTHGLGRHKLYSTWKNMHSRCSDPTNAAYANYGGRGISVCERWAGVEAFVSDLSQSHWPGAEIDRLDNDKGYEPSNCRWVTPAQNADNRRSGRKVTFAGKTQSIKRWSEELGLDYGMLYSRLVTNKWPPERALTTPSIGASERMSIARAATSRGF